ncbi:MAG: 16S rRNA methyltransferase [Sulfurovum sp. PC08-66]|nr:MAG: 16S rRNA methyltransferase [Sulfurovum sp. PC08-66]KIM12543.1 MAG: 16S rRNA methyltransferase [Sulfuricurvum sp. PC08-66]
MLQLVPTPIGNLSDISQRSLDALFGASIILCEDTRITHKLLTLLAQRYDHPKYNAKLVSLHSHNEADFIAKLTPDFFDAAIVYVSDAGMPGISDPGQLLVDYCLQHDIAYEVLAGASALLVAFVASGFNQTQFVFGGFLPHKQENRRTALAKLIDTQLTVILYEAPHRLLELLEALVALDSHHPIFVAKELSKLHETKFRGTAIEVFNTLKTTSIKGEWVVVLSPFVKTKTLQLGEEELLKLSLPPKEKAKLLAQLGTKSAKEWYEELCNA